MSAQSRTHRHHPLASALALGVLFASLVGCAACGDGESATAGAIGNAGGAMASTTTSSSAGMSSATTSGGGGDEREWKNLEWPGLPCPLLTAGPTTTPTLIWKACAVAGCSFIDPSPFMAGSKAVSTTEQYGNVITALVHREGGYDSVVWDATTGQERWAVRGHPDCMPQPFFLIDGTEDGLFTMRDNSGTFSEAAYYEVDLSQFTASKLNIPATMTAQRMAADASYLALENSSGPHIGI